MNTQLAQKPREDLSYKGYTSSVATTGRDTVVILEVAPDVGAALVKGVRDNGEIGILHCKVSPLAEAIRAAGEYSTRSCASLPEQDAHVAEEIGMKRPGAKCDHRHAKGCFFARLCR